MKAIIPTGGSGTRMRPLTFSSNKHFIPIANKPLIFYPIETIANAGIKEVAITYNPGGLELVKKILGDGSQWGLEFSYILQEKPAGLANIVQVCEEYLAKDSFVLHLGDNIFTDGIKEAVNYFEKNKPNGLVTMVHHKDNTRLGVPYFDDQGRLLRYVEKPQNPPHDFAIPGLYFADANFFKCFREDPIQPSARGEYEIPDAFQWMIDHEYRVDVLEYKGKWMDPGKFDDWIETNEYILEHNLEEKKDSNFGSDVKIEGKVSIGKDCQIENSTLVGPLVIGDNVVVKNANIGPFASIADGCKVADSSIKNSVIMPGVVIAGVKEPIAISLIGSDSQIIGNGQTVKLFIGEKCRVEL
jgi:glucose-1-phosphate thymidylyltransferase